MTENKSCVYYSIRFWELELYKKTEKAYSI